MIDYSTIPDWVRSEIDEWAAIATWPGSFVEAVLKNELQEAFSLSMEEDLHALHSIIAYVYNHVPSPCWRTAEKMKTWQANVKVGFDQVVAEELEKPLPPETTGDASLTREADIRSKLAAQLIAKQRERSIRTRQSG